jgi:hypothetical protein
MKRREFIAGRRGMARPSTVGHITTATGAPQRPDAAAHGGGACTGPIAASRICSKSKHWTPERAA